MNARKIMEQMAQAAAKVIVKVWQPTDVPNYEHEGWNYVKGSTPHIFVVENGMEIFCCAATPKNLAHFGLTLEGVK